MSKVGENIKTLRLSYGETQEQLAKILNCKRSAVSNYEKGERQPDLEVLQKIAIHYDCSLDELIRAKIEDYNISGIIINYEKLMEMNEVMCPFMVSDNAMKDKWFVEGYNMSKKIMSDIRKKKITIKRIELEKIINAYEKSFEEMETLESLANMIIIYMMWWASIPDGKIEILGERLLKREITLANFTKMNSEIENSNKFDDSNKKMFMKEVEPAIIEIIKELKSNTEYRDFAEYYLALRYLIGMVDTGYSRDINEKIGIEMMLNNVRFDNIYAFKYFDMILKF